MDDPDGRTATEPTEVRLPRDVVPSAYRIDIEPDLDAATFAGTVVIDLDVVTATDVLVCNAAELEILGASLRMDDGVVDLGAELDPESERLTLRAPTTIRAGRAELTVRFTGVLNDKLRGFYRSTYTDGSGQTHVLGVTQFEATDARRAFPCWDEPDRKATFAVVLTVGEGLLAVANGPELARTPTGDGRVRIEFGATMPMSTYLVAWTVGALETSRTVDAGGVPLRIVHEPGKGHLAELALEIGAFALDYFADYYGIPYPGEKMDMVAVPDFAFGAMENLGCVIYRETLLLIDPETATQSETLAVVDVIAHELAHMWFGDLVTMEWWNGIWLNEAFATFMEMKCSAAFRPEWERWQHFGRERTVAFDTDALVATRAIEYPVHSPADAEGMFDVLTYQKGSAVVRMLEQYLGEDRFRDGIRRYLDAHRYANTRTEDLWDALEAETGEPVRAVMDSWIFQGGFPLVDVTVDGDRVHLAQAPFGDYDGDRRWKVPLVVRQGTDEQRLLLDEPADIDRVGSGAVVANGGGHGFFRVRTDPAQLDVTLHQLASLEPLERYAVVDDQVALVERGDRSSADLLAVLARLASSGEADQAVWQRGLDGLGLLRRIVDPADREDLDAWVREALGPVWTDLGDAARPGDDPRTRALRGHLLDAMAGAGDPAARAVADRVVDDLLAQRPGIDAGLAAGALTAAATLADGPRFDALLQAADEGATAQDRLRFQFAAARVRDPQLFDRYLDRLHTDAVRSQNLAFAVRAALQNRDNGARAWDHVAQRWEAITDRLPFNATHRMLEGITVVTDPELAARIGAFLDDHDVPNARPVVAQHREQMAASVRLAERERPVLRRALG